MHATPSAPLPSRTEIVNVRPSCLTATESRTEQGSTPLHHRALRTTWRPATRASICSIPTGWTFFWPGFGRTSVGWPGAGSPPPGAGLCGSAATGSSGIVAAGEVVDDEGATLGGGLPAAALQPAATRAKTMKVAARPRMVVMPAETTRVRDGFRRRSADGGKAGIDPCRVVRLPGRDLWVVPKQVAHLVGAREQHQPGERVDVERERLTAGKRHRLRLEVDSELGLGIGRDEVEQRLVARPVDDDRQQPVLQGVAPKDVGKSRRQDRPDAPRRQCPWGVFARGSRPEVVPGEEDLAAGHLRPIEDEPRLPQRSILVEPPVAEERLGEAQLVGDLEVARRDDLVGVDVLGGEWDDLRRERGVRFRHGHRPPTTASASTPGRRRGSLTTPAIADAAAVSGEARRVRPPLPWRPSKLRFEVLIAYCPGANWSPFIAMHIEQPASRHSAPAARKTSARPSRSASRFTSSEPGTTMTRTPSATCRSRRTEAARRRSLIRPLVHEPMKTTSTFWPRIAWPGRRSMYSRARSRARRWLGSAWSSGDGTRDVMGIPIPGLVPYVTMGSRVEASMVIERS